MVVAADQNDTYLSFVVVVIINVLYTHHFTVFIITRTEEEPCI